MALRSKEVQRQYPSLLEKFLDFCNFQGLDVVEKAINFSVYVGMLRPHEGTNLKSYAYSKLAIYNSPSYKPREDGRTQM
jgi:hypothetical protein